MDDLLRRLSKYWLAHKTRPASAVANQDDVSQFQKKYGVRLPSDLEEYVLKVNGNHLAETLAMDSEGFSFLPLSVMQTEEEWSGGSCKQKNMFVIADFLAKCYWYCVELDNNEHETTRVFFSGGAEHERFRLVAASLEDFFELYMMDSPVLHPMPLGESK